MSKLVFVYSPIYDMMVREWRTGLKDYDPIVFGKISKTVWDFENIRRYQERAMELQKQWGKIEKKVIDAMQRTSSLKIEKGEVKCYILNLTHSFSDPMTLGINAKQDLMEAVMHELGHRLIVSNMNRVKWNELYVRFGKETNSCRNHILLHAVLELAYTTAFGKARTKQYIAGYKNYPKDYRRAWEIVKVQGARKLVDELVA